MKPQEFAQVTRVAEKTLRNIECRENSQPVAIEVVNRFARQLGIEPEELLAADTGGMTADAA
jgi:hypothetical protein